jgi:UDP-N-acetylglucosamine:LPS N-acetylglucosamine transferase
MGADSRKLLVVSSVGGHLTEVMHLGPLFEGHEVVLVVNEEVQLPDYPFSRVYRIEHAERDWRQITNLGQALAILEQERPDVVLSAGASPAVMFAIAARLISNARVVFLESAAAVDTPTLTGRLMYPLADEFYIQWPALKKYFPRGLYYPVVFGDG